MAPRPRKAGNEDLPVHVATNSKNGVTYYRYSMPDGQYVALGNNRDEAIETARALNNHFGREPAVLSKLMSKIRLKEQEKNPIPFILWAVDQFNDIRLQNKTYAESVRENHRQMLNNYKELWATKRVNEVTHEDVVGWLNDRPPHAYVKHKDLMAEMWQFFMHQGWCKENLPEMCMDAIIPKKARLPIKYDEMMQIRAISPDYLQRAIDLAFHSLQRREDLSKMVRSMVNIPANTLTVEQGKSQNYEKPIWIEIDMHPELLDAVMACLSTQLAFRCQYLLAYIPKKMTKKVQAKPHHMMMTPDFISREFHKYREIAGIYDHLLPEQKPTFHEIRALGEFMVMEKYGKDYAKSLAGHTTEAMYNHYVDRHEKKLPNRVSYR